VQVLRDITERKKIEEELEKSEKKYREAYNRAGFYKDLLKCYEIGCQHLNVCRGGCRYRAFVNTGDILGINQYRCAQFNKK